MDHRSPVKPVGDITRGTTGINRLRKADRWLRYHRQVRTALAHAADPLIVDVGYGAAGNTTFELADRLAPLRPDARVIGLEIDPARVIPGAGRVSFARGGFELAGLRPVLVRAFNVLRQYPEAAVGPAWDLVLGQLAPGGLFLEGTCDELGRHCAWILLDRSGPLTLTLAWSPPHVAQPSDVAPRLPKALIHRNIVGEPIYDVLRVADACWAQSASYAPFGPRERWRITLAAMRDRGVPVAIDNRARRDNVLTVPWSAVAPRR